MIHIWWPIKKFEHSVADILLVPAVSPVIFVFTAADQEVPHCYCCRRCRRRRRRHPHFSAIQNPRSVFGLKKKRKKSTTHFFLSPASFGQNGESCQFLGILVQLHLPETGSQVQGGENGGVGPSNAFGNLLH
jgi:hypothetical protein